MFSFSFSFLFIFLFIFLARVLADMIENNHPIMNVNKKTWLELGEFFNTTNNI